LNEGIRDNNTCVRLCTTSAEEQVPIEQHVLVSSPECRTQLYRNKSFGKNWKVRALENDSGDIDEKIKITLISKYS